MCISYGSCEQREFLYPKIVYIRSNDGQQNQWELKAIMSSNYKGIKVAAV